MSGNFVEALLGSLGIAAEPDDEETPADVQTAAADDAPTGGNLPPQDDAAGEPGGGAQAQASAGGGMQVAISPLYGQADFQDYLMIRACSYDIEYPANLGAAADQAVAAACDKAVANIEAAIAKAMADLRAGLGTADKPGKMSYSEAEKDILDPLNKRVQIEYEAILDNANRGLRAAGAVDATCDAVARFSKFKFLANLPFPGGGAPSIMPQKIKPLLAELQAALVETKTMNTLGAALANVAGQFAAEWKAIQGQDATAGPEVPTEISTPPTPGTAPAPGTPPAPVGTTAPGTATGSGGQTAAPPAQGVKSLGEDEIAQLRPKVENIRNSLKGFTSGLDKVDKLHEQIEKVTKQIERISKKEGGAASVAEDKKAYGAVEASLTRFKNDASKLTQMLTDAANTCQTLTALLESPYVGDTPTRVETTAKNVKGFEIVQQARELHMQAKDLAGKIEKA